MTTITLPWPPAVNNLFLNVGKRRVRTKRYDAWIADAAVMLRKQDVGQLAGRFNVSIRCSPPDRRKRDLDGLAKAPLDFLVKARVIEDDSLAQSLTLSWSLLMPAEPGFVTIELEPA